MGWYGFGPLAVRWLVGSHGERGSAVARFSIAVDADVLLGD